MNLWGITDVGSVRKQNQDAYFLSEPDREYPFAVVCDGMGGTQGGDIASTMAVRSFAETMEAGLSQNKPEVAAVLKKSVDRANELVRYRASVDPKYHDMGTTLVAAVVEPDKVRLINIGDSRAYLISPQGIRKVTRDHSLVEDLVRSGKITSEAARTHAKKNYITRALGVERIARADLYEVPRREGDVMLLCSDGLSNTATDQELLFEVLHGGEIEESCQRLLQLALSRGAPDNVTAVIIQL